MDVERGESLVGILAKSSGVSHRIDWNHKMETHSKISDRFKQSTPG